MIIDVPDTPGLTWMERSVLALMAKGMKRSQVAVYMGVTPNYVSKLRLGANAKSGPCSTRVEPAPPVDPVPLPPPQSTRVDPVPLLPLGTPPALAHVSDSSPTPDLILISESTTPLLRKEGTGGKTPLTPNTNLGALKLPNIVFDWTDGIFGGISDAEVKRWEGAYPACDVEGEIGKAAEWLLANPKQRKKNYRRFLTNWLTRTQDRGGSSRRPR